MFSFKFLTFAPLELPGRFIIRVFFLIPATGLEIMAIGVTPKDLDNITKTSPVNKDEA